MESLTRRSGFGWGKGRFLDRFGSGNGLEGVRL